MKQRNAVTPPADPTLDTLLHALSEAEPPPGFAERLTAGLQSRSLVKDAAPSTDLLSFPKGIRVWPNRPQTFRVPPRVLPWVAAITTAAAACLLVFLLPRTHSPSLPYRSAAPQPALLPQAEIQSAPQESPTPLIHLALTTHPSARKAIAPVHAPAILTAQAQMDQQALDDLHAPSQPAPPLPPTQQERLVALMLRRGERHDLAQLETGKQAFSLVQDRAAFSQFFDPPEDPAVRNQPRSLANQAAQLSR